MRHSINMDTLRQAIEQRNADLLMSMYADEARAQIVDRLHPPSSPLELRGKQAISDYMHDICQRNMGHRLLEEVVGDNRISFYQACQYPNGQRVLASSVLDLQNGKIVQQTIVQAWDE